MLLCSLNPSSQVPIIDDVSEDERRGGRDVRILQELLMQTALATPWIARQSTPSPVDPHPPH